MLVPAVTPSRRAHSWYVTGILVDPCHLAYGHAVLERLLAPHLIDYALYVRVFYQHIPARQDDAIIEGVSCAYPTPEAHARTRAALVEAARPLVGGPHLLNS